jgi:hypothetical protein
VGVVVRFREDDCPHESIVRSAMADWGYTMADGSMHITSDGQHVSWRFVMVAMRSSPLASSLFELSRLLRALPGVAEVEVMHARN